MTADPLTTEAREDVATIQEWFTGGSKKRWRTSCWHRAPQDVLDALDRLVDALAASEQARQNAETARNRASFLAEHLFQMIDPQTWRDHGGDDGQGHYEGDYHASGVQEEIRQLRALAAAGSGDGREIKPPRDPGRPSGY